MTDPDRAMPRGCLLGKMRVLSSRLGRATQTRVDALRDDGGGRVHRHAFMTPLTQMALGEDPELLRAQAGLAFAGLTGGVVR
ncbi:MAG: hypothetical protein WCA82_08955 [Jiangellales bacterium]